MSDISGSDRIHDWLRSACGESSDAVSQSLSQLAGLERHVREQKGIPAVTKRSSRGMENNTPEETPRVKRRATGIATPTTSNNEAPVFPTLRSSAPSTSPSRSTAASRSSSPSARAREIETEFCKPQIERHNQWNSKRWVEEEGQQVPLLHELRTMIAAANSLQEDVSAQFPYLISRIDELLVNVAECVEVSAPEETWSDLVIHPAFLLASQMSKDAAATKVLNVKQIDIAPKDLLPTSSFNRAIPTKRVDYSIGLKFADRKVTRDVRRKIPSLGHSFNHTIHQMTSPHVFCSHLEIKITTSTEDGMLQLCTWTAANFAKLENMWLYQKQDTVQIEGLSMAPIPLWVWRETSLELYIAVMDPSDETLHIIYEMQYIIDTSPASILTNIPTIKQVVDWGHTHYLPWFKRFIGYEPG